MKTATPTPSMIRQRKFLLVLPLIVIPFLTLFFWAMGGGKGNAATGQINQQKGFNSELPDAKLKDNSALNKMGYYDKAAQDSDKLRQQMKSDPYYHQQADTDTAALHFPKTGLAAKIIIPAGSNVRPSRLIGSSGNAPVNEALVYQKLAALQSAVNKPAETLAKVNSPQAPASPAIPASTPADDKNLPVDPEIKQMNGMLEKILDIQHPDRVNEQLKENSEAHRGQVFTVAVNGNPNTVSTFGNASPELSVADTSHQLLGANGFFGLDDPSVSAASANAIQAVVQETQTLVSGSIIKLRLTNPIYINGVLIPKDNFVFGQAALNGERLAIKIASIRYQNSLFPVSLSVYDIDGLEGIDIPGAISRDVAKSSADQSLQTIGLNTYDPSLGAQAAGAGIEAAKTLFSKKVKLIKVVVKAGYQVLLYDEKAKQAATR